MTTTQPQMVFVGGAHRSGTTLIAKVLAAAEECAGLSGTGVPEDEGQHLHRVLPAGLALGGPTRWALHPQAHAAEAGEESRTALREEIEAAWAPYWSSAAPIRIEKSPPNVARMRFLQSLWPDAKFIVITRHPLIQSLAVHKWDHNLPAFLPTLGLNLERTLQNWFAAHDLLARDAPAVDNLLVIRYEQLMSNPARELRKVRDFLGLASELDASLIQPSRSDAYRMFVEGQRERPWGPHAPVMARRRIAAGPRRAAFHATWAVVSRADAVTGRYTWMARRYESRAQRHGYSMLDLDAVSEFSVP